MGNIQLKTDMVAFETGSLPAVDDAAWLDQVAAALASGKIAPWRADEMRLRLKDVAFAAILSAIDRGRPAINGLTEIALYQHWIDANSASPVVYAAWFNLGALFVQIGNTTNARIAYTNALAFRPDMHAAAINLGLLLEATNQPEQALATWKQAVQPVETRVALEIQQGRLLEKIGRLEEAEQMLSRVLMADPAQPDVIHHLLHIRQKICQWPVVTATIPGIAPTRLLQGCGPLGILALTDDIDLQREAATAWMLRKTQPAPRRLAPATPYAHQRIRVGYLSSDFCSHAMSYLVTELFERHDRRRFEIFGYCSSAEDGSELRKRVLASFDQYRLVRALSDEQAAQIIRDDEIDVLIDLNGITDGTRMAVLRWRPAPIQATYLGYIGPVPLPELDYLLCDNVTIPPEHASAYQPKPLSVGTVYQANDSKRTIGRAISRAEAGVPEDRFLLCCFTKHFKITEEMFAAWMTILQRAERAVLWLTEDNEYSRNNLIAAAARAGIEPSRLIFTDRADPDLYLSRLGVADLFLDTFPYNAGTVASDAMRMQLPLITLCGRAFASRMASSLLHALGANEGITTNVEKYVDLAVRLANDPAAYARYRTLFTQQAWHHSLGDIGRFTTQFEDTLCRVVAAAREGATQSGQVSCRGR